MYQVCPDSISLVGVTRLDSTCTSSWIMTMVLSPLVLVPVDRFKVGLPPDVITVLLLYLPLWPTNLASTQCVEGVLLVFLLLLYPLRIPFVSS